jgi:diguanylate cyclase (GGDEF)-like protein
MFSRSRHRTNPGSVAALLIGIALVPVSLGLAIVQHDRQAESRKKALQNEARAQADRLDSYYSRARSLALITARNPSFRDFYSEAGARAAKIRAQGKSLRNANAALAYLEQLFPGSIGEACFIDRGGAENARAVKGKVEAPSALSADETGASFFDPTFALEPGEVYQSAPYVSPDTNEWVIANSTPIRARGVAKPAIVHFEITIESIRGQAEASSKRFDVAIVNARTGDVVIDSRLEQRAGKPIPHKHADGVHLHPAAPLGRPGDERFKTLAGTPHDTGTLDVGDKPAAFARVDRQAHNSNRWIVAAVSPTAVAPWYASLRVSEIAMMLGALLLLGFGVMTLRSSQRELKHAALHDSLTGMPNRRSLMSDLERCMGDASPERPLLLALFDLDGFKSYNDSFGHPVGDTLLVRLGGNLSSSVNAVGRAYRMGGDEFCVLARIDGGRPETILESAGTALTEHGTAFTITASYGSVLLPTETEDGSEALRLADQRMYARKGAGRASAGRQSTDVLLRMLAERDPDLGSHLTEVMDLCRRTASRLDIPEEDLTTLTQAAALHDVGKSAVPDGILDKPGPLTDDEMLFIRRHTIIGERILGAAPALSKAAKLVRWSHERFDGAGYPDGIGGEEIPMGARIICVCDAYHAMVCGRPYRAARSSQEAIAELRRCAGSQFDPVVVEAFCAVLADEPAAAGPFAGAISV